MITEAEHLGRWFGDAGADVDLRPGGGLVVRWTEHGVSRARVVAVDPPTGFSYRWAPFKDPGGDEPVEGNSTLVEFTLAPEGDGTRLRVVESGFSSLATSAEQRARNHASNTRGWDSRPRSCASTQSRSASDPIAGAARGPARPAAG